MREFEAKLRAEIDSDSLVPSPPPAPYEIETPVGINAIRTIRRED